LNTEHLPPNFKPQISLYEVQKRRNLAYARSYAQLLRIPNVFTAIADIGLGAVATGSLPDQFEPFVFLVLASSCLYCAGMVWNDFFDYEQDLKERPGRPLPSHRISRNAAVRLGTLLLAAGMFFAGLAGQREDGYRISSVIIAGLLMTAILLYDSWLTRTFLGPVSLGLCRFLNVLLGLTVAEAGIQPWGYLLALIVGIYIVGVTWFARREARLSKQLELAAASVVMLTALALALFLPVVGNPLGREEGPSRAREYLLGDLGRLLFPYLLVAFGFWVGIPAMRAVRNPMPMMVQAAVKRAVLGLIAFDAVLAMSLAGTPGLLLLLLLPPALVLGRWVYST
jgi:4-hydroxybenzoate polyprenyltransferase